MKYLEDRTYDVIVAGGGPAGVPAGVAAAREGADVLVVERFGFLGGMATAGLVNPWMPFHDSSDDPDRRGTAIVTGIMSEIDERLAAKGGLERRTFDPEILKLVLQEMIEESGVSLLCHAVVCGAERKGDRIKSVKVAVKGALKDLAAKFFIDCTGDADLSAAAGAEIEKGRAEDGLTQPCTLNFRLGGVDKDEFRKWRDEENKAHPGKRLGEHLLRKWQAEGLTTCARDNFLIFDTTLPGVLHFNQTRVVKVDVTDPNEMTRAQVEGQRQVGELMRLLRENVPCFRSCYLHGMAPQIGVRESRRVMGDYVLTEEDVLGAAKFEDGIARVNYPMDIHNPAGAGTVIKGLEPGTTYEIPYRCLTPRGLANLLVAGRPISATHEAHSSLRVMPYCVAMGQAAGIAAAMALAKGTDSRGIDAAELRERTVAAGGNLEREPGCSEPRPASAAAAGA